MDREATVKETWTFAGLLPGYEVLLGPDQQPLAQETMLDLAGRVGLTAHTQWAIAPVGSVAALSH